MNIKALKTLKIKNAYANNLKNISLDIPIHQFVVVTGVSGSGKSSLAFDVIAKEGQRRVLETLPNIARQHLAKYSNSEVESIEGLPPVIALGQKTTVSSSNATVGTISDIYDWLRILFARAGKTDLDIRLHKSLFSFQSEEGKCKTCNGLGEQEKIDINKLVVSPEKTLRDGALAPTLPTGYIMYSQVTIDVLNTVCEAEGFNVDIPWKDLTDAQKNVILYGSDKIKVPFGKHSLESRLKWTGIKAKPREEGYYKGMIPIMSDILKRDRNANILKYVSSVTCSECSGHKLNKKALSVLVKDKSISTLSTLSLVKLYDWLQAQKWNALEESIVSKLMPQLSLLIEIGLGYLSVNQEAKSLRASEAQRIRLVNQLSNPVSDVLYVFDEPSIGLHPEENKLIIQKLKSLVAGGSSVMVVEHDLDTIQSADWIIDIGPRSGVNGGVLLYNGNLKEYLTSNIESPTLNAIQKQPSFRIPSVSGIKKGKLNVISGRSGSGKGNWVKEYIASHKNDYSSIIEITQKPIGRTPRSNPATYLGISDHIRDLFAKLPESKERKYSKSRYSFNTKGGRCETCQGAGQITIGMHLLGSVAVECPDCSGKRFNSETLEIQYKGKSISDIYDLSVSEAVDLFEGEKKVLVGLNILDEIGLGYLKLGQSAMTLSGGEAQRIKLANHLQKASIENTLFVLDEPSIGLHYCDIQILIRIFESITSGNGTVLCMEQDEVIIDAADTYLELSKATHSVQNETSSIALDTSIIQLKKAQTNNLTGMDVSIPKGKFTTVTGVSGSGKSSLVYDTLLAEGQSKYLSSLNTYARTFIKQENKAVLDNSEGVGVTVAIPRRKDTVNVRSTVGTATDTYSILRLYYSRIAQSQGFNYSAQEFSFNHQSGACEHCKGLGVEKMLDEQVLIQYPDKPLLESFVNNKTSNYYTNPDGQFIAVLKEVFRLKGWDNTKSWNDLSEEQRAIVLYGTGEIEYELEWEYKTKTRSGIQQLKSTWKGFANLIEDEYLQKLHNKSLGDLPDLLHEVTCKVCNGNRLKKNKLEIVIEDFAISDLVQLPIYKLYHWVVSNNERSILEKSLFPKLKTVLERLLQLGLGYLTLDRPLKTLSGGETQRVALVRQLGYHLSGVTYILDEPTIGLDTKQIESVVSIIQSLKDQGNTVVAVEHNQQLIQEADHVIELGPGSGKNGGSIVYEGKPKVISSTNDSITFKNNPQGTFGVKGATLHNLKNVSISFNKGQFTNISGVSGSGKSSLLNGVLYASYLKNRNLGCEAVFGLDQFDTIHRLEQSIKTFKNTDTPIQLIGLLDHIQKHFSQLPDSKGLGLKKGDFLYTNKKSKCLNCKGLGILSIALDHAGNFESECGSCGGLRYNKLILSVKDKGYSIGALLQLTFDELLDLFKDQKWKQPFEVLNQLGLGHIKAGQSAKLLSTGETQRLKLAQLLLQLKSSNILLLLDEPTVGLHKSDIIQLLEVFKQLTKKGATIVSIDHNELLTEVCDTSIVLGPGSGDDGGMVV